MPVLTPDQVDDLAMITLSKFHRLSYSNIATEYTHLFFTKILRTKKVQIDGGKDIRFFLSSGNAGTARPTTMFDQDLTGIVPVMKEANVPWRLYTANYSYSIEEPDFQSQPETLVDQLKAREAREIEGLLELMESEIWSAPSSPTDNHMWGIPLWIQKAANTTPGFLGGDPSGFSSGLAGIPVASEPNWRNYAGRYVDVSVDDLIRKIKSAVRKTAFESYEGTNVPELSPGKGPMCEMYTTESVIDKLERIAEQRNDNLGKDVAKYMDQVTIAGRPVHYVPYLDANTDDNPIYGCNWRKMAPYVQRGWNMKRTGPNRAPLQRHVRTVHLDLHANLVCTDRRRQFVLNTA
jgi:hypothetical protein